MKQLFLLLFLLCNGLLMGQKKAEIIPLHENWYFTQVGKDNWMPAVVPGSVHQDLIRNQILPDPFYGKNEEKIQWVEEEEWEYKTVFSVTAEQLSRDAAFLSLEGLDTYADVYLNGACILRANNMYVGYKIPVKHLLHEGENRLHIYFYSPIRTVLPQWRSNGFNYPASNDHRAERLSVFTRKAPFHYGWDWGMRMVTSGIWRPISLCFQDVASIEDCYIRQQDLKPNVAKLSVELEVKKLTPEMPHAVVQVAWSLPGGEKKQLEQEVQLMQENNLVVIPVEIEKPELWMPNGWGKPTLYDFEITISLQNKVIAEKKQRVGLRTIRVVKEKDAEGESFYFEVNGIPMFAKGANYVPIDIMLPSVTPERYLTLFKDAQAAHMNMLRVWGGGIYENDCFYDLADEHGILIWQDFMFACTSYPHDSDFLSRVKEEAVYNIKRLRNHACLAMWCGNNEIAEAINYWGWKKRFTPEVYAEMQKGYKIIFEELLPEMVNQWDKERFYMHSSPYASRWSETETWKIADSHYWGVWSGKKPFSIFDEAIPRFMSEYGFQAFPEMKTIATFATSEDYSVDSDVMKLHQKSSQGSGWITTYMEWEYQMPKKFEDYVYVSLIMQGHGIRQGLEAHRRNRPYCMGTLYWQLNDNWPVISWSGIDYYGNWKALHYQAKRVFAPLFVDVYQKENQLEVWLMSDCLDTKEGMTLEMQLTDFYGKVQKKEKRTVVAPSNSSVKVAQLSMEDWVSSEEKNSCYLLLTLRDKKGQKISEEPYFFVVPKELKLPETTVSSQIKVKNGVCEVTLKSDALAKDLFIDFPIHGARFSDNFFDLLPKKSRKITITSPLIKAGEPLEIKIKHLQAIY